MVSRISLLGLALLSLVSSGFAQSCKGQSCAIAALAGSSKENFDELVKSSGGKPPTGSNGKGQECITKHYKLLGLPAPTMMGPVGGGGGKAGRAGKSAFVLPNTTSAWDFVAPMAEHSSPYDAYEDLEKRQGCKPFINLFARGTTEPGTMGTTVGPKLSTALSKAGGAKFQTTGVPYTADINGINCIGFPGGVKCVDQLAKLAQKCPQTKFFLSGYSQGAMVARICAAFSTPEVQQRIKGIATFGDPFNGASVKGLSSDAVKVSCNPTDGVCQGKFSITAGHLSYSQNMVSAAAKWMVQRSGGAS